MFVMISRITGSAFSAPFRFPWMHTSIQSQLLCEGCAR